MILDTVSFSEAIRTLAPTLLVIALFFILVLGAFLWMVQSYFNFEKKSRLIELRTKTQERTLPLQLNAYERAILFLERINPNQLFMRNYESGMKTRDLQKRTVDEIRTEFEHNLTQQIYISPDAWDVLKKVKDETIMLINGQLHQSGEEGSALDFTRQILEKVSKMEVNPYDYAINIIKKEAQLLF